MTFTLTGADLEETLLIADYRDKKYNNVYQHQDRIDEVFSYNYNIQKTEYVTV